MLKIFFSSFLIISMTSLFFSKNWLFLWAWVECVTLCLIVLLRAKKQNTRNLEAVSKYFVTQAMASVMLLIGILFRYNHVGSLGLSGEYDYVSFILLLTGLLMKLGVFPNPYWFVDVVKGVSYSRLMYILVFSKVGPLYLFFSVTSSEAFILTSLIGAATAVLSSVLGINQSKFRKIMSFSSVANLGWFVLCVPVMSKWLVAFCFFGYAFTVMPLVWMSNLLKFKKLKKVSRLYYSNANKLLLLLCLFSLGGLPPFVGFFVKWTFFQSLVNKSLYFMSGLLVMSSLLSLFFYLYSSFKVHSLFSPNLKGQNLLLLSLKKNLNQVFVGVSATTFMGLFAYMGLLW